MRQARKQLITGVALMLFSGLMIALWWSLWRDQQLSTMPTSKEVRATEGATHEMRDKCLTEYGGYIELHYTYATTQTFSFDLCDVIDCKGYNESWRGYDVYLCIFGYGVPGYQKWCKYKAIVMSLLMSIATFIAILTCCGCCLIPCLRTLLSRLITVALTKESESPKLQLPLLQAEDYIEDSESEDDCDE